MLRMILLTTALIIAGCGSKEKAAESKTEAKQSVKKSAAQETSNNSSSSETAAVSETMETIMCSYNNDNRKISSVKLAGGGCEVHYEKFGEKKVVATANYDLGYCSQMANKVSNNLEEAGFTCK